MFKIIDYLNNSCFLPTTDRFFFMLLLIKHIWVVSKPSLLTAWSVEFSFILQLAYNQLIVRYAALVNVMLKRHFLLKLLTTHQKLTDC